MELDVLIVCAEPKKISHICHETNISSTILSIEIIPKLVKEGKLEMRRWHPILKKLTLSNRPGWHALYQLTAKGLRTVILKKKLDLEYDSR